MDGPSCPSCGAGNTSEATFCWQCYARFGASSARPASAPVLVGAMAASPGTSPVAAAHGGISAIARATNVFASESRDPYAARKRQKRPLAGAGKLLPILLLAAGGWFGYQHFFGGISLPDSVAGLPRVDGEAARRLDELLSSQAKANDVRASGAAYGDPAGPSYVLLVVSRPDGEAARRVYEGTDVGTSAPLVQTQTLAGGVTCATNLQTGQTSCAWPQDGHGVLLGGTGVSPLVLQLQVPGVQRALDL